MLTTHDNNTFLSPKKVGTLLDFLRTYRDVGFANITLCEVDILIFAIISYVDMKQLSLDTHTSIHSISQLSQLLLAHTTTKAQLNVYTKSFMNLSREFFSELACATRYQSCEIHDVEDCTDDKPSVDPTQFAACTFLIPDVACVVAYRGTDLSLAGWKEDLLLCTRIISSQTYATAYLSNILQASYSQNVPLIVCGHSKGGILASYASVQLYEKLQVRIKAIYDFDGPHFSPDFRLPLPSTLYGNRYIRIQPTYSIVGQVFDSPEEPRRYIKSSDTRMSQHSPITWLISGSSFADVGKLDDEAAIIVNALKSWEKDLTAHEEHTLIDEVFSALEAGGHAQFDEILQDPLCWQKILAKAGKLSSTTKRLLREFAQVVLSISVDAVAQNATDALENIKQKLT